MMGIFAARGWVGALVLGLAMGPWAAVALEYKPTFVSGDIDSPVACSADATIAPLNLQLIDSDIKQVQHLLDPNCKDCSSITTPKAQLESFLASLFNRRSEAQMCATMNAKASGGSGSAEADKLIADLKNSKADYQKELARLQLIPVALQTQQQKDQSKNYQQLIATIDTSIAQAGTIGSQLGSMGCQQTCDADQKRLDALLNDKSCLDDEQCASCSLAFRQTGDDKTANTGKTTVGDMCGGMEVAASTRDTMWVLASAYTVNAVACGVACASEIAAAASTAGLLAAESSKFWSEACKYSSFLTLGAEVYEASKTQSLVTAAGEKLTAALLSGKVKIKLNGKNIVGGGGANGGSGIAGGIFDGAIDGQAAKMAEKNVANASKAIEAYTGNGFSNDEMEKAIALKQGKISKSISACIGAGVVAWSAQEKIRGLISAINAKQDSCRSIENYMRSSPTSAQVTASCKVNVAIQRLNQQYNPATSNGPGSTDPAAANEPTFKDLNQYLSSYKDANGDGLQKDLLGAPATNANYKVLSQLLARNAKDKNLLAAINKNYSAMRDAIRAGKSLGEIVKTAAPNLSGAQVAALNQLGGATGAAYASLDPNRAANEAALAALRAGAKSEEAAGGGAAGNGGKSGSAGDSAAANAFADGNAGEVGASDPLAFGAARDPASDGAEGDINPDASKSLFDLVSARLTLKKRDQSVTELAPSIRSDP